MGLNYIVLMGRLTKDPEYRMTQTQKAVTSFKIAVDRDYNQGEKQTDFVDIVTFGKTAEFVHSYFSKGMMAIVEGKLQSREWTDKNDQKRVQWEVLADRVRFGESKREKKPVNVSADSAFTELSGEIDGELPF